MSTLAPSAPVINNDSLGPRLMSTNYATISIALAFVIARLYTKYFLTKTPGWEDFLSVAALLLAIARLGCDARSVYRFDLGKHITAVPKSNFEPLITFFTIDGLLYIVSITLAKLAILLFLYRIFKIVPKFRYTAWAVGTIATLWASITVLLVIFSCRPVVAAFKFSVRMRPTTVCPISAPKVTIVFGICNIFIDFMLLIMPMPLLWTLHMTAAKKLGVSVIFANGLFIGAIAIVRQYKLYHPPGHDPLWQTAESKVWMAVEVNFAIICGCLPVLNPLFRKIPLLSSHIRSKLSGGHSGMEKASWPERLNGPRGYQVHDVEQGSGGSKAPWREPDESLSTAECESPAESCESPISMYHLQQSQQRQDVPSALEPAVIREDRVRMDRLGTKGETEFKGLAM